MKKLRFFFAGNKTALAIKVGALILAILLLYRQDLALLGNEAIQSDLASYMLIVPFMLAYLIHRRRKILRAVIALETPSSRRRTFVTDFAGGMLCLLAFLLYWQGSYTFYPLEYHLISLPVFVSGCILIIFNMETLKTLVFPMALLFLLLPPPFEPVLTAGAALAAFSSQAACWILEAIGLPVKLAVEYGNPVILLEKTPAPLTFTTDIACGGIHSLIAFAIFALFVAYVTRGPAWKKAPVFFIGLPLVYALNVTRITLIVFIGFLFGQQIAMELFHLFGGWFLILVGTLILLYLSEKIFKIRIFDAKSDIAQCSSCTKFSEEGQKFCFACGKLLKYPKVQISRQDLLKIATLLISLSIAIPLNVPTFALTKGPARIITQSPSGEQVSTEILPEISGYTLHFAFRDKAFEKLAHQDASLVYAYVPTENSTKPIFATLEIAGSYQSLHYWEACILWPERHGLTPKVSVLDRREISIQQNPPIVGRFFSFQPIGSDVAQAILYWYERGVFDTGSGARTEYIKVSLSVYFDNPGEYLAVEEMLLPFAKLVVNYWEPTKTFPWIAVVIATEGKTTMVIITILLGTILAFQAYRKNQQRKSNLEAYNKLRLEQEKLVLSAVHEAGKGKPVGNAIASSYEKLTGKTIESDVLYEKLNLAEEAGFVKKEVASQEDEPLIVWKSLIGFPREQLFMSLRLE